MIKNFFYLIIITLLSVSSIQAQTTEGQEFWLTFGTNGGGSAIYADLQIRIVAKDHKTSGSIFFTNLGTYKDFEIEAREVYTYILSEIEKPAVYNAVTGITNYSVHVTTDMPVTVYALNQAYVSADATNILPVTALDTAYYQIAYTNIPSDAYAVIATENNTEVYQKNIPVATLNRGDVYYKGPNLPDMTGDRISANKPIAHFALTRNYAIFGFGDNLFQQMAPIRVWGKNFFSPVSHPVRDVVRIVVSQPNTNITQIGGTLRAVGNSQMTLSNLQPGQFVELEVPIGSSGCYIQADKPVGVCTFYAGGNLFGDSAPAWLPPIEQSVTSALVAPFIPSGDTNIHSHYAVVTTPTVTRENTMVSIGGLPPTPLSGGSWIDNGDAAGMSFYKMLMTNATDAYYFTNPAGFLIFCYGWGSGETYYYLGYSAMRDLDAAFYANDIHFQDLEANPFCEKVVDFRAEIEGELHPDAGRLKWFIDGAEETAAQDQLEWSKTFAVGEYEIEMLARFETDETVSKTGILKIESCDVDAAFYANDVYFKALPNTTFCDKKVDFRAEIEGALHADPEHLKWFIDGVEEVAARDLLEWSKLFETGVYAIEMWARFANGETVTVSSTLKVTVFWIKMQNVQH